MQYIFVANTRTHTVVVLHLGEYEHELKILRPSFDLSRLMREVFSGPGDRADVPNLVILLTDGTSQHKLNTTEAIAWKHTADIIAIGIGKADQNLLRNITSTPDMFLYVDEALDLMDRLPSVISLIGNHSEHNNMTDNPLIPAHSKSAFNISAFLISSFVPQRLLVLLDVVSLPQ